MRKTYRVYLRSGAHVDMRASNFTVTHQNGKITGWEADNVSRWVFIDPDEIVAVSLK